MKIICSYFLLFLSISSTASVPNVDDKILEAFSHTYGNERQVQWTKAGNNWQAYFQQDDIINRLEYNQSGELVHATRYYQSAQLAPHLLAKLHRKYQQHSIFGVTEVTFENRTTYYIVLEDGKNWYHVTSNEYGQIDLKQKYRKA